MFDLLPGFKLDFYCHLPQSDLPTVRKLVEELSDLRVRASQLELQLSQKESQLKVN